MSMKLSSTKTRKARKAASPDNRPYASKLRSDQNRLEAVMDKTAKGVLTQGQELYPKSTVVQTTLTQSTRSSAKLRPLKSEGRWLNRITKTGFPKTTSGKARRLPNRAPSRVAGYLKDGDSILSDHSDDFDFEKKGISHHTTACHPVYLVAVLVLSSPAALRKHWS